MDSLVFGYVESESKNNEYGRTICDWTIFDFRVCLIEIYSDCLSLQTQTLSITESHQVCFANPQRFSIEDYPDSQK
jgi:hypothetical protein